MHDGLDRRAGGAAAATRTQLAGKRADARSRLADRRHDVAAIDEERREVALAQCRMQRGPPFG